MNIRVNGKERQIESGLSLQQLVENLVKKPGRIIAELNGSIVKRNIWHDVMLQEGDVVELVHIVGGG